MEFCEKGSLNYSDILFQGAVGEGDGKLKGGFWNGQHLQGTPTSLTGRWAVSVTGGVCTF